MGRKGGGGENVYLSDGTDEIWGNKESRLSRFSSSRTDLWNLTTRRLRIRFLAL